MRERHFPRQCRTCQAPMARQESACWSCGSAWEAEPQQLAQAAVHLPSDVDRWVGDGGLVGAEPVLAGS